MSFELVFPVSRRITREQGYLDRLLAFQSRDPETAKWFAYMQDEIGSTVERKAVSTGGWI